MVGPKIENFISRFNYRIEPDGELECDSVDIILLWDIIELKDEGLRDGLLEILDNSGYFYDLGYMYYINLHDL